MTETAYETGFEGWVPYCMIWDRAGQEGHHFRAAAWASWIKWEPTDP